MKLSYLVILALEIMRQTGSFRVSENMANLFDDEDTVNAIMSAIAKIDATCPNNIQPTYEEVAEAMFTVFNSERAFFTWVNEWVELVIEAVREKE